MKKTNDNIKTIIHDMNSHCNNLSSKGSKELYTSNYKIVMIIVETINYIRIIYTI